MEGRGLSIRSNSGQGVFRGIVQKLEWEGFKGNLMLQVLRVYPTIAHRNLLLFLATLVMLVQRVICHTHKITLILMSDLQSKTATVQDS